MAANYLIGLREGLEAAIIVGVLVAYLIRVGRRDLLRAVVAGVSVAIGFSVAIGAALTIGQSELPHGALEVLEGVMGLAAAALMTWVVFWVARTARSIRARLESSLDHAVGLGRGAVFTLSLVAVGREGLEIAIFMWAGATTAGSTPAMTGLSLGLMTAIALGWAIQKGAVRIDLGAFFRWTGLFLIVLAAGLFAHGLRELQEAGVIGGAETRAFDVSAQVPPDSWHGIVLKGVFNFSPNPSVLEVIAWLAFLTVVLVSFAKASRSNPGRPSNGLGEASDGPLDGRNPVVDRKGSPDPSTPAPAPIP